MRERTTFGQVMGLFLMLVSLVVFALLSAAASPTADRSTLSLEEVMSAGLSRSDSNCANLVTPDRIGHGDFERYGLAEKLQNNEFEAHEYRGYTVCKHGQPRHEVDDSESYLYYMFDKANGQLTVTSIEWGGGLLEPTSTPEPTRQEAEAAPTEDFNTMTICFDSGTPIIEVGSENPEQWGIWDILSSGRCAVEMGGSICWDCGEEPTWRWLVPPPTGHEPEAMPSEELGSGMACIDARMAVQISGQELDERDASKLASGQCDLQLGGGQVCWHCREARPEPTPSPLPSEHAREEPLCSDYLTPEVIGLEAWEKYGIADKLRNNQFGRHIYENWLSCYHERKIDDVDVFGDKLHYILDTASGELLVERIHWREDLPEHLPSPLISRQEAEAMVKGEVRYSYLAILSPDPMLFETAKSSFQEPCWFVGSSEGDELPIPWLTVINAMTGRVLGRICRC